MLFIVCLFFATSVGSITADCGVYWSGLGIFPPYVFSKDGNLLPVNSSLEEKQYVLRIPANDEVILSCAPNHFDKESSSKTKTAKCVGYDLEVDAAILKGCERSAMRQILHAIPGCRENATSIEFGYENPIKQESIVLGEACYDETEGRTLFVHTKLVNNGNSRIAALKTEGVNYFVAEEHPGYWYQIKFYKAASTDPLNDRLEELLASDTVPYLTYRNLVTLPVFQHVQFDSAVNSGWNLAVVNGVDELPNHDLLLKDIIGLNVNNIDIYFGTNSIFSMQTASKGSVDLHLIPYIQKFPVPKYLWVAVKTASGKGAGFLISNYIDATVEELTASQPCDSKCAQMTWLTNLLNEDAYKKPNSGFVTCCDLNSFRSKVSELPPIEGEYDLLIN